MLFFVYLYFLSILVLAVFGMQRTYMLRVLTKKRQENEDSVPDLSSPPELLDPPKVCVQLPVYNEPKVIERLLECVAKLEYPRDCLEIQVLDDSSDETSDLIDSFVQRLEFSDLTISVIRRSSRRGYKAGAMALGLEQTDAEFLAIFDADFTPTPDFLLQVMPCFKGRSDIAFVQTRWGYLNRERSVFTRAQAVLLDGHFVVEHAARYLTGAFFNFNGTAGVWRRDAIVDAGGWQGDTITEDLDLSYRAQLKGWRGHYLRDYICESELPESIDAFKSQQYRWTKGSIQTARKLIPEILRSSDISLHQKVQAFFHLCSPACYLLGLLVVLLLVPVSAYRLEVYRVIGSWFELCTFFMTLGSLFIFYFSSQNTRWQKPLDRSRSIFEVLTACVLGIGMSAHCALGVLSGLRSKVGEFVRTPKTGVSESSSAVIFQAPGFKSALRSAKSHAKESVVFLYLASGLSFLSYREHFLTVPFLILLLSGYALIVVLQFYGTGAYEKESLSR